MDNVQIIPVRGKPLLFGNEDGVSVRLPSSERGFFIGEENSILPPMIQEIINGRIPLERQPILLYGEVGSGRTHLLKGILQAWRQKQSQEAVRRHAYYSTCADFARHFTDSVAARTTEAFRQRYGRAKLILLDDLEQLFGKPNAQMELRLLLDALTGEGVLVLTAESLPQALLPQAVKASQTTRKAEGLSSDLATRIQAGTAIPIALPSEAVRRQFLQHTASALGISASEKGLLAAAKKMTGTIPKLYAAVAQQYLEAKAAGEPLTADFWHRFSRKRQGDSALPLTEIAKRTAAYFSLKLSDLKGPSRSQTIVLARSLAVYLAKTKLQLTFKEIGLFFGKRDSSTVRHLFEKVTHDLPSRPELQDHLFRIERM